MFNHSILKGRHETVCCNLQVLLARREWIVTCCEKRDLPEACGGFVEVV